MRKAQTTLRQAIAYLRKTRFIGMYEREAIRLLKRAVEECDERDFREYVERERLDKV